MKAKAAKRAVTAFDAGKVYDVLDRGAGGSARYWRAPTTGTWRGRAWLGDADGRAGFAFAFSYPKRCTQREVDALVRKLIADAGARRARTAADLADAQRVVDVLFRGPNEPGNSCE